MSRKPIHSRDKEGRHKVDLTQLPAPARYGIALAVVVFVVGLAMRFGRDRGITDEVVSPYVPYIGAAVVLVIVVAVVLQLIGRR